jgi:hypothetical protein
MRIGLRLIRLRVLQGVLLGRSFLKLHSIQDAVSVCPSYHSRADIKPSRFIPPWRAPSAFQTAAAKLEPFLSLVR